MPSRSTAVRGHLALVGIATAFFLVALGSSADATSVHGSASAAPTGVLAVAVHTYSTPAPSPTPTHHPYVTVAWTMPSYVDATTPTWPQHYAAKADRRPVARGLG